MNYIVLRAIDNDSNLWYTIDLSHNRHDCDDCTTIGEFESEEAARVHARAFVQGMCFGSLNLRWYEHSSMYWVVESVD